MNSKILIIYDYFYPAYKAGGITQSLYNLFSALQNKYSINVICSNSDLNNEALISDNKLDNTLYISKFTILKYLIQLDKISISFIYLNGIFSLFFFVVPLVYFKIFYPKIKIIVAPRGMMQAGALEIRSTKKNIYIKLLKILGFFNNNIWHATDEQELIDIKKTIGENSNIIIAKNIPKTPNTEIIKINKKNNSLKLVFMSLITEKKNLHLILESIKLIKFNLFFDIYGPIKDASYWELCKTIIINLPANIQVNYKGSIEPIFVQDTLQKYHALILPSKGENFGHAIYEALSVGRPIIISNFTPWNELNERKIGWNVETEEMMILNAINELNLLTEIEYELYCQNSLLCAKEYYKKSIDLDSYYSLFK